MGIRLLNTLIKNSCREIITKKHLSNFYGKKIVIDISIYAWRYLTENALVEKIYLMCLIFKYYKIIPIFIFDGKSPEEKNETIKERQAKRNEAKGKLFDLQNKIQLGIVTEQECKNELIQLKKQSARLTRDHIKILKNLISSMGYTYIEAEGEADILCAQLSLNNEVFACLSEDTDMFAYQCPNIIRYISLSKHTVLFYDFKKILKQLKVTREEFRIICMLSSNDYSKSKKNVYFYYNKIMKYKNTKQDCKCCRISFIQWLLNKKYINPDDLISYENNIKMYSLDKYSHKINYNTKRNHELLQSILEKDNFLFVK